MIGLRKATGRPDLIVSVLYFLVVLQRGTAMLLEHLAGSLASAISVSTQLDIAPQHHLAMMGRNGSNIKHIMQRTGAQVHFPDPNCPQKKSTVYIQGTIDSVCLARQYLMVTKPFFFCSVLSCPADVFPTYGFLYFLYLCFSSLFFGGCVSVCVSEFRYSPLNAKQKTVSLAVTCCCGLL